MSTLSVFSCQGYGKYIQMLKDILLVRRHILSCNVKKIKCKGEKDGKLWVFLKRDVHSICILGGGLSFKGSKSEYVDLANQGREYLTLFVY